MYAPIFQRPLATEYAAFYADCQHEVKPLESGFRLCLTYNLALAKPRSKISVKVPDFEAPTQQLESILRDWPPLDVENGNNNKGQESPKRLAVMLEHQYTEDGLSIDNLKGVDLAKANLIFDAAERADCEAYLALITLWQSGVSRQSNPSRGAFSARQAAPTALTSRH
jgi:hypothetical protein